MFNDEHKSEDGYRDGLLIDFDYAVRNDANREIGLLERTVSLD